MRIYLAARYSRRAEMTAFARELARLGHAVTSRWLSGEHGFMGESDSAREDLEDIENSDCLIAFTEEPRSCPTHGGRHVEFGYALAGGLVCLVCGPRENVFHSLPGVDVFESQAEVIEALERHRAECLTNETFIPDIPPIPDMAPIADVSGIPFGIIDS